MEERERSIINLIGQQDREQAAWFRRLDREVDNLRLALDAISDVKEQLQLRRKIGVRFIETVRGLGYRFVPGDKQVEP